MENRPPQLEHVPKKTRIRRCLLVFGLAAVSLLLSYLYVNQNRVVSRDKSDIFSRLQYKISQLVPLQDDDSEVVFVNTSCDVALAERYHPDYDEYLGHAAVTDRLALLRFLEKLDSVQSYKYLFLDIRFEAELSTPYDSALFAKIVSMPRIVIANHADIRLADSSLLPKTALNDYSTTLVINNFTRYRYIQDQDRPSVALRLCHAVSGDSLVRHCGGLWYSIPGKGPCYNAPFIIVHNTYSEKDPRCEESDRWIWQDLSHDVLSRPAAYLDSALFKDKYIFVGDMEHDVHDTYAGSVPGSVITYRAFQTLMQGRNLVRWWLLPLGLLLYAFLYYRVLWGRVLFRRIHGSRLLRFVGSFFGYGAILTLAAVFCYLCAGTVINVFVPTVLCTLLSLFSKSLEK